MKNYAIYARYSTDLQDERSIEDQVRDCQKYINVNDGTVSRQTKLD